MGEGFAVDGFGQRNNGDFGVLLESCEEGFVGCVITEGLAFGCDDADCFFGDHDRHGRGVVVGFFRDDFPEFCTFLCIGAHQGDLRIMDVKFSTHKGRWYSFFGTEIDHVETSWRDHGGDADFGGGIEP